MTTEQKYEPSLQVLAYAYDDWNLGYKIDVPAGQENPPFTVDNSEWQHAGYGAGQVAPVTAAQLAVLDDVIAYLNKLP